MKITQQVQNPGQWIRQWQKFSQGLADRPLSINQSFKGPDGRLYFGLPVDPRRDIPGYLQDGDTVLFYGHCARAYDGKSLTQQEVEDLDRQAWLSLPNQKRCNTTQTMIPGGHLLQIATVDRMYVTARGGLWAYRRACLALPLAVHEQRLQELADPWPDLQWDLTGCKAY